MQDLKPIETRWKGYRFRSRLEAKWAVFFERVRIPWIYEPEGFALPSGPYLPDFKVGGFYVEIKPADPTAAERDLLWELSLEAEKSCLLIAGQPYPGRYKMERIEAFAYERDEDVFRECQFKSCRRCDGLCIAGEGFWSEINEHTCGDNERWPTQVDGVVLAAFEAASGARFEHGEKP